jgi:hypothetical protein
MGDWKWDDSATATSEEDCTAYCTAYLWIVPAQVDGAWTTPQGKLTLEQTYQNITGTLASNGRELKISDGKLNGDKITFNAGGVQYSGQVRDDRIEGLAKSGAKATAWSASRASKS